MTRNFRCSQCNKVSDQDIETNANEVISGDFYHDKRRDKNVCRECQEVHEELMSAYYIQDDHKFNRFKP